MIRCQPRNGVRQTAYEGSLRKQYDGEIIKFGEVAMGRTPHDIEKRGKKLDFVWDKGCRTGRTLAFGEHVLLTEEGVMRSTCVRRTPSPSS